MLITGKKKKELTAETILEKISEYDIYRMYLKRDFELGTSISSPFRKDKNPSFFIGNKGGFIHHIDLANSKFKGNCFKFVMQLHSISYGEALKKIDKDFGLGIGGREIKDYQKIISTYTKPEERESETIIKVANRPFNATELAYWNQRYLDKQDLKDDGVYAIKKLWVNGLKYPLKSTELVFGYLYEDKWKIYWPHRNKKDKWRTNVPISRMGDLTALAKCDIGLILKSKKEKMIAKKFLTIHSCETQNESNAAISSANIKYIQENVKHPYVIFDNDKTGVEASIYYNQFGFNYWNVPQHYRTENIKDMDEFIVAHGPDKLLEEIQKKIKL